ncbi:MAG: replication-associated recombination protein A [Moorellales bacterium]
MSDLFALARAEWEKKGAPLAWRMRPRRLEEMVGQEEIIGPGRLLRRAIEEDRLSSLILVGPPGSGKTTLAEVIAHTTRSRFLRLSAVTAGVADLRQIIREAEEYIGRYQQRTILLVDEIHRFNRAQQDALLPAVERGTVILIGATTENPYFSVNSALLSRSRVVRLNPLTPEAILVLLHRALEDKERGLGGYRVEVEPRALEYLAHAARGDARIALNALELAVLGVTPDAEGRRKVNLSVVEEALQQRAILYDREGDQHYDVVSAFIKSLRGSDPDAALHYLARMLAAGEDPRFVARRLVILASEDVGLADPQALVIATAAAQAVEYVGMPEAELALAEAAVYLALAPKSNSVHRALAKAKRDVATGDIGQVPPHLRDANYPGAARLGHGVGYKYPHDYPGHWVEQQYLPDPLVGRKYYQPSENGWEAGRRWAQRGGGGFGQEGQPKGVRK